MAPTNLIEVAKEVSDIIKPFGHTDVLLYYASVATKLKKFLVRREIATKIWLPHSNIPFFLKRGSKLKPIFIEDFSVVDENLLRMRAEHSLNEIRNRLTEKQILLWDYFVPRKLMDFFYACNKEGQGKPIDRIFIDIDKGKNVESEITHEVAKHLVEVIKNDDGFNKLLTYKLFVMWTGSSFHIYLILDRAIKLNFYNQHIAYSKNSPLESFTGRWAEGISKETGINVQGGHEKTPEHITIDPSGTPSGKLARCPFSLHMKSATEIDGVALPIDARELRKKGLVKRLRSYTPKKVINELDSFSKLLPN
jgi:hypothetical protein